MKQILTAWYASQNEATKTLLQKVVAKKVTLIVPRRREKAFSFVEILPNNVN